MHAKNGKLFRQTLRCIVLETHDFESRSKTFKSSIHLILGWQNNALDLSSNYVVLLLLLEMNIPFILSIIISYLIAIVAIAFYTLLERKALGYFQLRKGPNKVGFIGIPQPFADAIKLFTKEQTKPKYSNLLPYIISPITRLILALLL